MPDDDVTAAPEPIFTTFRRQEGTVPPAHPADPADTTPAARRPWQCLPAMALASAFAATAVQAAAPVCQARATGQPPQVVELYTSEGCNSCPPADAWLASLAGRDDVLAASFHVDYWDRLGWKDRFASPAATERQRRAQALGGASFIYTPQVLVDGRDWRAWPDLPRRAQGAPAPALEAVRDGEAVTVQVGAWDAGTSGKAAARGPLSLWWALLEDGHHSAVRAGENAGRELRHEAVARRFGSLPAWPSSQGLRATLQVPVRGEGGRPARLLIVVTEASSGRTVQALQLTC